MKMKNVIPMSEHRYWKNSFLNTLVSTNNRRKEYCKQQVLSGRKDHYIIYTEAKRLFKWMMNLKKQ